MCHPLYASLLKKEAGNKIFVRYVRREHKVLGSCLKTTAKFISVILCCAEEVDIISFPFKTHFRIFILLNHLTKGGIKYLFWKILEGYSKLFN